MIRGRLRRFGGDDDRTDDEFIEIDPSELSGLFAAPNWLRDAGFTAWLLVGVILLAVGVVWFLSLTAVIFVPLIVAGVISAVAGQLVALLKRHGVPRAGGAYGPPADRRCRGLGRLPCPHRDQQRDVRHQQAPERRGRRIEGWLKDLGVSDGKAEAANQDVSSGASDSFDALINGVVGGIEKLASLAFFVAMAVLSLFFLLKDGPTIRSWSERHMGVPSEVAHTVTERTLQSLRGYFLGVTIVAVFSAVLVGGGALALGVPLAGTIAVITFIGGYVPYLGAWTAGAFSVLLALGGAGTEAAAGMVVIQLLSNGPLQQIVQPVAYGAALGLHPLAVLVLTISGAPCSERWG